MFRRSSRKAPSSSVNQSFNSAYPATDSKRQVRLRVEFEFPWHLISRKVCPWLREVLRLMLISALLQHPTPQTTPAEEPFLCTLESAQKSPEHSYFESEFRASGRVVW